MAVGGFVMLVAGLTVALLAAAFFLWCGTRASTKRDAAVTAYERRAAERAAEVAAVVADAKTGEADAELAALRSRRQKPRMNA